MIDKNSTAEEAMEELKRERAEKGSAMTIQEAYAAIDAVAKPNQAVFIGVDCNWYDHAHGRELGVSFRISLVPGFSGEECDQWTSGISLENVVRECVEAAAGIAIVPAIETAHALIEEASSLALAEAF